MFASILLVLLLAVLYIVKASQKTGVFNVTKKVSIQNRNGRFSFYRDGLPFLVQGGVGTTHIKELAECGGNTLTCWDTANLNTTLQEACRYNISVIIGLDIPDRRNVDFYNDPKKTGDLLNAYRMILTRYRDHPSVLAYCLGNELEFQFSLTGTPFYKTYQQLLDMIKRMDPQHPVATSVINVSKKNILNIQWHVSGLDFICINTYNGLKTLTKDLKSVKLFWKGPYLISEWAPNGGWEADVTAWNSPVENTSTKKAEQFYQFYKSYMPFADTRFLGSMAFYWGNRQEYTNTWYSLFSEDGKASEVTEVLYDCWKDTITHHRSPRISYMLVDSLGSLDNIILTARSTHAASILMPQDQAMDSLYYSWQILKEDWPNWGKTWNNFKKPSLVPHLISDSTQRLIDFAAPANEGLYRIFVTVYNSKGYYATANTPVYVIEK